MTQHNEIIKTTPGEVTLDRATLDAILQGVDYEAATKEVAKRRDTRASRREAWAQDLNSIPMEKIEDLDNTMSSFTEKHVIDRVEVDEPRPLELSEVDKLADLYQDYEKILAVLEAERDRIRKLIYAHFDATLEGDETTPVEQVPGKLTSDRHRVQFSREGGKRKTPTLDWEKLKATMGEARFRDALCEATEVPAHTQYTPTEDKLMSALNAQEITLEDVRDAIIPGDWQTPRFVIRKVK